MLVYRILKLKNNDNVVVVKYFLATLVEFEIRLANVAYSFLIST